MSGEWHGTDGPHGVSNLQDPQKMTRAFIQSCQEMGIPYNPDFNGPVQKGVGAYQVNVVNGRRCSAAVGYLKPAMKRPNLTVQTSSWSKELFSAAIGRSVSSIQPEGPLRLHMLRVKF